VAEPDASGFAPAQVWAARSSDDVISWAALGGATGTDPVSPGYGSYVFDGGSNPYNIPGFSIQAHYSYLEQGYPAMQNMGNIITGNYALVTPPPPATNPINIDWPTLQ
jgi:hypothetical protein